MRRQLSLIALAIVLGIAAFLLVALDELVLAAAPAAAPGLALFAVGAFISVAAIAILATIAFCDVLLRWRRERLRVVAMANAAIAAREDFLENAPTQPFAVYGGPFAEDSPRARAETARRVVHKVLGGMVSLFLISPLFTGCSGKPKIEDVAVAAIDCIEKDPSALATLKAQAEALWAKHDIAAIVSLAVSAGDIGGCMFAELHQEHTAPQTDGRAAEPVDARLALHKAFEDYRAKHAGGAAFRTADGEL